MKNTSLQKPFLSFLLQFVLLVIFLCLLPRATDAQTQNIRFKHLSINDGLSHSWVHSIIQDKYGFIWIGTDDGLNRYDGYNFHVYKNNSRNKYSISSSNVMAMLEDSSGQLWICTRQGLNLYDRQNDRFIRYPQLSQQEIMSIAEDKDRNLWIGTTLDLHRLDLRTDSVYTYTQNIVAHNRANLNSGGHRAIFIDSRDNLWIGSSYGLHLYDKEKDSFIYYYHDDENPNSLSNDDVHSILEDKAGRLWIGTAAGLDLFVNAKERPGKGIFIRHQNNNNDRMSISRGTIQSLLEDDKHNLWIGFENGGLDLLNLNTYKKGANNFAHFKNDPNRRTSLSNNSIYSLCKDIQGNIWIGTFGDGVNIINPESEKFIHLMNEPGIENSLNSNQINAFLEDNDFLWIGTEGGGLNRYNKRDDTFKHYTYDPLNRKSIGSNSVWSICKDKLGNLWVGTWGGGLNRFDYKTETFDHYYNDPGDTNSIGSNNMFSIFEDSRENLWIGTMGGGLNMFDRKKKVFIRYNTSNSEIYTNYIQSIIEAKNGDLWFADGSSFEHFNITTKKFENFMHSVNDSTSLSSNKVISIFGDSKGNIWMGTDVGLNLFIISTRRFKCYQIENGLPDNCINSILEDNQGNLWIGTNKGLSKFINAVNLPVKPEFKNYTYGDGLQGNSFSRRSCYRGVGGMMYFGGTNGFNIFDPAKITENIYVPPIVITDFQIFNKSESIGDKGLKKDVGSAEDLVLSYTQSVFSFDFAALNYISSAKNEYAYKMEGFDKDWNYVGTKHTVTYTNLDPGKYVFRVKGSNNDGVWNEEGISIPIMITPPYWKTLWFRLILLAVFLGIIFWIYKWRVQLSDLSAQRRMEAALTKERNLLRTLIDNIPDAIYVKDTASRKTIANLADVHNMHLHSESEVLGKNDFELFPKELAEGFFADDQSVIQTGQPVTNREEYVIDEQGQERWLLTTKVPLRDENNQIIGLVGVGKDITIRKQFEKNLQNERNLLRTLIDNLPDYISIKDIEGRFVVANMAVVHQIGFNSPNELIGKSDYDLFPRELADRYFADEQKIIQSGQGLYEYEGPAIDKSKEDKGRWVTTIKVPLRDAQGKIISTVSISRDITERKKAEAEREKLITQLQDALADVKLLSGLVPICANCKKIRDDQGYWTQIESYIQDRSDAKFSHSICPDCAAKLYPNYNFKK
jgi:PAS domain S-box-containing protein